MTPTVLLFNFSPERASAIQKLCMTHRLRTKRIAPCQFSLPLQALLLEAAEQLASPEEPTFTDEMMVFAGLAPGQLNNFLHAWRKAKLAPVPLKAILTPTNSSWTPVQLKQELRLEHEAMQAGNRAHTQK